MKQKQKGWGLVTMIIFMSILLAFLLLTVIMVYSFNRYKDNVINSQNGKQEPDINNTTIQKNIRKYRSYESRIKEDAITYAYTYYIDLNSGAAKITVEDMVKEKIMNNLIDPEDDSVCTGYALVKVEDGKIISTPYLKCENYISAGYEE